VGMGVGGCSPIVEGGVQVWAEAGVVFIRHVAYFASVRGWAH
jgi:hypothetical protein